VRLDHMPGLFEAHDGGCGHGGDDTTKEMAF
jgi:hypothetical protein